MRREADLIRREEDKIYTCHICGRQNKSHETLLKDNKPECLYACMPIVNSIKGIILNITEKRSLK